MAKRKPAARMFPIPDPASCPNGSHSMLRHVLLFLLVCLPLGVFAAAMPTDARPLGTHTAKRIDADLNNILRRSGTPSSLSGLTILDRR